MFPTPASLCILAGMALGFSACVNADRATQRPVAVAVAISPIGTRTLSADQVAQVHEALKPEILRAGYSLAPSRAAADLVLIVSYTPVDGGSGGRVKIMTLEPTARFLQATDGGDTPEAKEMRRRQRELEQWIERQSRSSDS